MQKLIISMLVFCFFIAAFAIQASGQDQNPKMVIPEPIYNAGEAYRSDGSIEHVFVIKNTGTAELKILSARPG
jgi:hypothetical protein